MPNDNFDEPISGAVAPNMFLPMFKFTAAFYLKVMQRSSNKFYIPQFVNILKAFMNKDSSCGRWLIE